MFLFNLLNMSYLNMKIGINIEFFFLKNTKLLNIYNSVVHYLFKNHNYQYTFTWENFNNGIFYNT